MPYVSAKVHSTTYSLLMTCDFFDIHDIVIHSGKIIIRKKK